MPQRVFDPCGVVDVTPKTRAPRITNVKDLRLGVLDNTKWNGAKLLDAVVEELGRKVKFGKINRYRKETFTKPATPDLLREIAANSDVVLMAIAD